VSASTDAAVLTLDEVVTGRGLADSNDDDESYAIYSHTSVNQSINPLMHRVAKMVT